MSKGRLEAFSDAVIAIIITIMVLELVPPHGATLADLVEVGPIFLAYVLSFIHIAIYWNNHHHLLQISKVVTGRVLWANVHLLFWLSLVPFTTAWMGEQFFAPFPVALYGLVLLLSAFAYGFLVQTLRAAPGQTPQLAEALGNDLKGRASPLFYAIAIPAAFLLPAISLGLYAAVAGWWLIPDRRIERRIGS